VLRQKKVLVARDAAQSLHASEAAFWVDDPASIAWMLTKQFHQHIHGDRKSGFSWPLRYPSVGWR
jgi:hypothetical protein